MFDTWRAGFLHSDRSVVSGADRAARCWVLPASILAWILCGCSPHAAPEREEDSLTSGRISIVCAPEAVRLIRGEVAAFEKLYPQARIELRTGTSRQAVGALFAAECDLAVITRELETEERAAAVRGKLELDGYRFARDAVVAVVNPSNTVENLSLDELRRIYQGNRTQWSELGGRAGAIDPVVQPMESDITQFVIQQVMGGETIRARVLTEPSDSSVVARTRSVPGAVGYVSMAWANHGARPLALASVTGLPYRAPDAEAVYKGEYPLTRFFNLYVRSSGPKLANGFITYVTSREGQALVIDAGLVPTTVPVRFVRRSPMLGAH